MLVLSGFAAVLLLGCRAVLCPLLTALLWAVVMMRIATLTASLVTNSGRSTWFVGVLVMMVCLIFAMTTCLSPPRVPSEAEETLNNQHSTPNIKVTSRPSQPLSIGG